MAPQTAVKNEFAEQDLQAQQDILRRVFYTQLAPGLENPFQYDANGNVVGIGNRIAFKAMTDNLAKWHDHFGTKPMAAGRIVELIAKLDLAGLWPHVPKQEVKTVTVAPTRREEAKINHDRDRKLNSGDSPIKGLSEDTAKPRATREDILKVAQEDTDNQRISNEVAVKIESHRHHAGGRNYSATEHETQILRNIREAGIANGTPWAKINEQIDAKKKEMLTWSTQQALKELHPELFTSKKTQGADY